MKAIGETIMALLATQPLAEDPVARRLERQAARRAKSEEKHAAWRAKRCDQVRRICKAKGSTNVYEW